MSLVDVTVSPELPFVVTVSPPPSINLTVDMSPDAVIVLAGNVGPPGPQGKWVSMTQDEYDAIIPDPDVLYIIVG